jgi:hypothetical protein
MLSERICIGFLLLYTSILLIRPGYKTQIPRRKVRRRNRRPFRPIRREQVHAVEAHSSISSVRRRRSLGTYLSETSSPIRRELAPFDAAFFSPPEVLTSHTRTVQSSPPLTSVDDSELKESDVIGWVWPLIVLISWPCSMSQSLIVRSCAVRMTSQRMEK